MRYFVTGTVWAFLGRAGAAAFALANAALIAKLLCPADVGVFFLLQSAAFFGALFLRIGLDAGIARFIPRVLALGDQASAAQYVYSVLAGMLAVWLLASGALSLLTESIETLFALPNELSNFVGFAIIWSGLAAFQHNLAAIHQARHDLFRASLYRLFLGSALTLASLLSLAAWSEAVDLKTVVSAVLVSIGTSVLLSLAHVIHIFPIPTLRGLGSRLRTIYSYSYPLVLNHLSAFLLTSVDLWIVAGVLGKEGAAIYAVASRFVVLMSVIVELTNAVLLPELGRLIAENERAAVERLAKNAATLGVVAGAFVMILILSFGEAALDTLFGDHFRQGAVVLALLACAQLVVLFSGVCEAMLVVTGRASDLVGIGLIALLAALVSIPVLGLWQGIDGAALGVLIAIAIHRMLLTVRIKRTLGISTVADGMLLVTMVRSWRTAGRA